MDRLKIATTSKNLANVLRIDVKDQGKIQWDIRFNLPLCKNSVNHHTVRVLDQKGNKIMCHVDYHPGKAMISIYPLDFYEYHVYYTLVITKHVRSAQKKYLKKEIKIAFMINH